MELMVNKEAVTINEVVYDGCVQQPIECDFILPDYCPDILRVLKCDICAKIISKQVIGEKLTVDGTALLKLIYIDDGKCMRSHEHRLPFTTTVDLKAMGDNAAIEAKVITDYVNCRPISQRRLDVRGSLSVCATVKVQHSEPIVSEAAGMNVELKCKMLQSSQLIASVSRNFTIKEELELSYGKASIASIIRSDGACTVTDYKVIANKIIVKGELTEHILYTANENDSNADTLDYTLPFSQIIDVDGVDENSQCQLVLSVNSANAEAKTNNEGEARMIALNVEVCCNAKAFKNSEMPVVVDMYSTKYESDFQTKQVTLEKLNGIITDEYTAKSVYEMPDEKIGNIQDVWSEANIKNAKVENNELMVAGTIKTCMLVVQVDGESAYYERTADLEYRSKIENASEAMTVNCDALVKSTQYTMQGKDKIEVRSIISINACVFSANKENVLTDIKVNEKALKKSEEAAALTIYYAEKNESIWDIAKHYNTSAKLITSQNEIQDEVLSKRSMLLIPTFAISDEK